MHAATVLSHGELAGVGEIAINSDCMVPIILQQTHSIFANDNRYQENADFQIAPLQLEGVLKKMLAGITTNDKSAIEAESEPIPFMKDIKAVVLVGNASHESHKILGEVLNKLLEKHLGRSEDWFFQVIDPSQVVSIGAARQAKALVDSAISREPTSQQQTLFDIHEEL